MTPAPDRIWRRWRLLALCVVPATLEAAVLAIAGFGSSAGFAPQVTAPAPLGVFHDLRWLVVYHDSWQSFGAELVGVLVFRSLLDALIVREAWPEGVPRPPFATTLRRTLVFTAIAVVLLAPWVTLLFGLAVVSLSWLFFVAVPPALAVALLIHHGAVTPRWWREGPPARALGWVVLSFVVLTSSAASASVSPAALRAPIAAATGLFNAWAWIGVVHSVVALERTRTRRRFAPVAPAGLALILAVVVGGAAAGFSVATAGSHHQVVDTVRPSRGPPVLIAAGFGTHWNGHDGAWLRGGFDEERFSYRGLGPGGAPLPYTSAETHRSLPQLDAMFAHQVQVLHRRTGQRVSVVAISEGSLVAKTYLAGSPGAPVDNLVMVSPLLRPARVYYPPSGEAGWGMVGGLGLQLLTSALQGMSPINVTPSTPLFRSIVARAPELRGLVSCSLAHVHQVAVLPLADAVAAPGAGQLAIPSVVIASFHDGTLGNPAADRIIESVLRGGKLPTNATLSAADQVLRGASSAWQVPELALSLNPAWSAVPVAADPGGVAPANACPAPGPVS